MDLGTPLATKVLGGLSLAVVAALGWTFVVGPETSTLADTRAQIESVRDQNTALAAQLATLQQQRQQLGATRQTARELAVKFPPTADQPGLFEQVTTAAVDAGIGPDGVTTLAPTPPSLSATEPASGTTAPASSDPAADSSATGSSLLARQTVTVSVAGTYDQTQQLLENLEHMPRAYLISTITLSGDAATGKYATTIAGDMFVMPPVKDPGKTLNLSGTTQDEGAH
jgi:Tfp pilus assembly protein PilO